jgi:hypothetical protein
VEILPIAKELWRLRLLVVVGLALAVALALALGVSTSSRGVAQSRLVLDTPTSQLIAPEPLGAETLPWRASLMAHLTRAEELRRRIAAEAGIPAWRLAVVDAALREPDVAASLPKGAAEAAAITAAPYVLTVEMTDEVLPIISILAEAPDRRRAARLDTAAAEALKGLAPPPDAPREGRRALQGFVVEDVGPVRSKTVETVSYVKPAGAAVAVFCLWCVALVLATRLVARSRAGSPLTV